MPAIYYIRGALRQGNRRAVSVAGNGKIFVVVGEAVVNMLTKAMTIFNITLRSAFIVLGILMLVGYFPLPNVDPKFRIMFGVVFILYGLFRIVTLFTKGVQRRTL